MADLLKTVTLALLTALMSNLSIDDYQTQAYITAMWTSLLVVYIFARLDLYYFRRVMSGCRLEQQVAKYYMPFIMVLYGSHLLRCFPDHTRDYGQVKNPHETLAEWMLNCTTTTTDYSSRFLKGLESSSFMFRFGIPTIRTDGRWTQLMLIGILALNVVVCLFARVSDQPCILAAFETLASLIGIALEAWNMRRVWM